MHLNFSSSAATHAAEVHQLLVGMMPRGWRSVTIRIERDDDGDFVRLTNIDAQIPPGGGKEPPFLGLSRDAAVSGLNRVLDDLAGELDELWSGSTARMDRADNGSAALNLLGDEGDEESRLVLAKEVLMSLTLSDALFDALDQSRPETEKRQARFEETLKDYKQWNLDQARAELSFVLADDRRWVVAAQIVGSWSRAEESFVWGWDNASFLSPSRERVAHIRDAARAEPGLAAFTKGTFGCPEAMAKELALHAGLMMNARGVFSADYGSGVVFVAAMA
jgi:hypothetical protein